MWATLITVSNPKICLQKLKWPALITVTGVCVSQLRVAQTVYISNMKVHSKTIAITNMHTVNAHTGTA